MAHSFHQYTDSTTVRNQINDTKENSHYSNTQVQATVTNNTK